MTELVSIIIPVYNAERYINRCVKCILNQDYKNLEIIFINDGSIDNTSDILKKYKDDRIIIIEKENTGVSDSRNVGIKKSTRRICNFYGCR